MEKVFFAVPYKLFGDEYRLLARRACSDMGLSAVFGDEVRQADALIQKMCSAIDEARFGFFDITGFNPNVMIELGIAFCAQKKVFLLYNEKRHREAPAVKAGRELVPSDLQGHERFAYQTPEDFDRELRQTLRATLGIGQNTVHDLKQKIGKMLRNHPQPIRKIVESLAAPEQDVQDALYSMRLEKRVTIEGHGRGAKWRLTAH